MSERRGGRGKELGKGGMKVMHEASDLYTRMERESEDRRD